MSPSSLSIDAGDGWQFASDPGDYLYDSNQLSNSRQVRAKIPGLFHFRSESLSPALEDAT